MSALTEEDARKKWCPYLQTSIAKAMSENPEFSTNRDHREELGFNCIASSCMAWRVVREKYTRERTDKDAETSFRSVYKKGVRVESKNWPSSGYDTLVADALGYCGAFGRVEP